MDRIWLISTNHIFLMLDGYEMLIHLFPQLFVHSFNHSFIESIIYLWAYSHEVCFTLWPGRWKINYISCLLLTPLTDLNTHSVNRAGSLCVTSHHYTERTQCTNARNARVFSAYLTGLRSSRPRSNDVNRERNLVAGPRLSSRDT